MKIYSLLGLAVILISSSKSNACGTVYTLPSGYLEPNSVAISPDGKFVVTTSLASSWFTSSNAITIFSFTDGVLSNGKMYPLPSSFGTPKSLAFSQDGAFLATANYDSNKITIFTVTAGVLDAGTPYSLPSGSESPQSIAFSPDGSILATANAGSNDITVFTRSGTTLSGGTSYSLPLGSESPQAIAFSPDGSIVATANAASNDVTLFNRLGSTVSGALSYALPSGSKLPQSILFSPDGTILATANSGSNDVTLFNRSGQTLSEARSYLLPSGSKSPQAIAFSPNGTTIATGNGYPHYRNDMTVFKITDRDLDAGTSYSFGGLAYPVSIAFSPDGFYLITGSSGGDSGDHSMLSNIVRVVNTTEWCPQNSGCDDDCIVGIVVLSTAGALLCGGIIYGVVSYFLRHLNNDMSETIGLMPR